FPAGVRSALTSRLDILPVGGHRLDGVLPALPPDGELSRDRHLARQKLGGPLLAFLVLPLRVALDRTLVELRGLSQRAVAVNSDLCRPLVLTLDEMRQAADRREAEAVDDHEMRPELGRGGFLGDGFPERLVLGRAEPVLLDVL